MNTDYVPITVISAGDILVNKINKICPPGAYCGLEATVTLNNNYSNAL